MLSVPIGEPQPIVVTGIAFGEIAERIAKLGKGDAVSVIGRELSVINVSRSTTAIRKRLCQYPTLLTVKGINQHL
jgi:hypothetical protein